jgi:hypothetical protein
MAECLPLRKEMLRNPIQLQVDEGNLDFDKAREWAEREAHKISRDPLLLAWYDAKTGAFSPPVTCSGAAPFVSTSMKKNLFLCTALSTDLGTIQEQSVINNKTDSYKLITKQYYNHN